MYGINNSVKFAMHYSNLLNATIPEHNSLIVKHYRH
jgi:hypothetical protein